MSAAVTLNKTNFQLSTVRQQTDGKEKVSERSQNTCLELRKLNEDFRLKSVHEGHARLFHLLKSLNFHSQFINFYLHAMKKMLLAVGVFCLIQNTHAQITVNFEDLTLPTADTAWFGIDQSGGFTSGGVFFENSYNTQYSFWSKFVYSNDTDVTTPGSSNGHSAYAGSGANGSANYAVNNGGNIDFTDEKLLHSIAITNNTYAAISMLNGDAFGKQFGSPNNAMGTPDGTNGEDWFKLSIIGRDKDSIVTDTVEFYLADYRFSDNLQDYIVDTWQTVNLTSLGQVRYLIFELSSSDVGGWGMNTPAYFALDNLVYSNTVGISENVQDAVHVFPNPTSSLINVSNAQGVIRILNNTGSVVFEKECMGESIIDLSHQTSGVYFLEANSINGTSRTRIVKN